MTAPCSAALKVAGLHVPFHGFKLVCRFLQYPLLCLLQYRLWPQRSHANMRCERETDDMRGRIPLLGSCCPRPAAEGDRSVLLSFLTEAGRRKGCARTPWIGPGCRRSFLSGLCSCCAKGQTVCWFLVLDFGSSVLNLISCCLLA